MLDDVLLPAIVHALQDHTSVAKQEAAVKALGQVSASVLVWCGLVWGILGIGVGSARFWFGFVS